MKKGMFDIEFDWLENNLPEVVDFENPIYDQDSFPSRFIKFKSSLKECPENINFKINRSVDNKLHSFWEVSADCKVNEDTLIYTPLSDNPPTITYLRPQ